MTMSAGKVSLSVIPNAKGFELALKSALAQETGSARALGTAIGGKIAAGIAVALAAGVALSAKMAIEMNATDARIQGTAQITAKAAQVIGDAMLKTSGQSTFSGHEMAAAFAPVSAVVQQLSGHTLDAASSMAVMKAATDLAEASNQPLADTTANLVAIMRSYRMGIDQSSEASNILFNVSRLTGVGLSEITNAVIKLHGRLGAVSPTLLDTSTLVLDLARHGVTGSRGLMVLQAGLSTLLGGGKATNEVLKALGVSVYDSNGKFVGMQSVLAQLSPKLAAMTEQQRRLAEQALFGRTAAGAMNDTLMGGVKAYTAAAIAVAKQGAAEAAALAIQQSLEGRTKTLRATISNYATLLGEKLIPIIAGAVGWFIKHKDVAIALAGIIGTVMVGALAVWTAAVVMNTKTLVIQFAKMIAGWTGSALAALGFGEATIASMAAAIAPIAAVVIAIVIVWNKFKIFREVAVDALKIVIEAFGYLVGAIGKVVSAATHLPFIGGHFKGISNVINGAALDIGKFAKGLDGLANKKINVSAIIPKISMPKIDANGIPSISSATGGSTPDLFGNIAGLTASDAAVKKAHATALSASKKAAASLIADNKKVASIYAAMNAVIKGSLKAKGDLITAQATRDAAAQTNYADASFKLNRTFNDDKFKLDRNYQDQTAKLTRSYDDSMAAAQKSYDDSEIKDKAKHQDALEKIQQTYNDKVVKLNQDALDKQKSVIQKSMDLLRNAYQSATQVDVGTMFGAGGGVSGLLSALKGKLDGAKTLAGNAAALAAKGFSQTFIQQIVGQGTDIGNQMSSAILNATPEAVKQLQELYSQITTVSETGVNALSAQMSTGAHLATSALTTEYAQVAIDLKDSLASAYADLTAANLTENATFTDIMAASLKTLNDAKASAKQTLNQGLADAAISYANSLFDMNTNLNQGLADAKATLEDALKSSAEQFNKSMDSLQYSTMNKMAALQASLQATADAIAKISGASAGARVITNAPKLPPIVKAPSSGSLDMASAAARASAIQSSGASAQARDDALFNRGARGDTATSADIAALGEKFDASLQNQARLQQTFSRANGTFQ
jgi:TP901 family phage tail tape measure protein